MLVAQSQGLLLCFLAGKALEKAGGKEFLETVKELRKSQGPLEVAEGKKDILLCLWKWLDTLEKKNILKCSFFLAFEAVLDYIRAFAYVMQTFLLQNCC